MRALWRRVLAIVCLLCTLWTGTGLFGCASDTPSDEASAPDEPATEPPLTDETPYDPTAPVSPLTYLPATAEQAPVYPASGVHIAYTVNASAAGSLVGGETMQEVTGGGKTDMVRAVPNLGYRFVAWSDGQTNPVRRGDTATQNTEITALFDYQLSELPAVVLTTQTGRDVESKTEYIDGTLALIGAGEQDIETSVIELRGRGNYTWTAHEKKAYKVKFPAKTAPLSLGQKNKTWVLLANVCDQSLLRNHVALQIAREFSHITYEPNSTSVDLYLNGEYRGVYLLAEEITESHLALDDSRVEDRLDTGYLVELSSYATDVAFTLADRKYEIKSDLSSDRSVAAAQKNYIGKYMTSAYTALLGGDRKQTEQYIDVDTLVDAYLAEEVLKNLDMGWDSFYLHKDAGGRLRFGPLWDFDLTLGNSNLGCELVTGLYCATVNEPTAPQSNPWFVAAMKQTWFRTLVRERWDEMCPVLSCYPAHILELGETYADSFERNFRRWDIMGTVQNRETALVTSLSTYPGHVAYLASWLEGRIAWLDAFYHSTAYAQGYNAYPNGTDESASADARAHAVALKEAAPCLDGLIKLDQLFTTATEVEERHVSLLFDGDTATKWFSGMTPQSCVQVTLQLSEPSILTDYVLSTANNTSIKSYRNPVALVVYGSPDGKVWEQIDMVGNISEVLGQTDETPFGFSVDAPGEYIRYRFRFYCNNEIQLSELSLYGTHES